MTLTILDPRSGRKVTLWFEDLPAVRQTAPAKITTQSQFVARASEPRISKPPQRIVVKSRDQGNGPSDEEAVLAHVRAMLLRLTPRSSAPRPSDPDSPSH